MTSPGNHWAGHHAGPDSTFDLHAWERALGRSLSEGRWLGWRTRLLALAALVGCVGLFLLVRSLAAMPALDIPWRSDAQGRLVWAAGGSPWAEQEGSTLLHIQDARGGVLEADASLLQRSPRWLTDDARRRRYTDQHATLNAALREGPVTLVFAEAPALTAQAAPRGVANLGAAFWLMSGMALLLYLTAMVVALGKPSLRNTLYALMTTCQAFNLLFIAVESMPGLVVPDALLAWDYPARAVLDLVTGAAIVHATSLHPYPLPGRRATATAAWCIAVGIGTALSTQVLPYSWWWLQGAILLFAVAAIAQLTLSRRIKPHPAALILRRLTVVALGIWALLTVAVSFSMKVPGSAHHIAATGSMVWVVFLASLLALLPFLYRTQQVLREFSMLAGISTVATSLDLLFVAIFSLSQFASITLALFLSIGIYAGARQWLLNKMLGSNILTTERAFEQLYKIARKIETHPERLGELLSQLLRELFEPLEAVLVDRPLKKSRVVGDGSSLLVPVPTLGADESAHGMSIFLRYAHRGNMIFTLEDARLTDRICEQLKRAVAFDQAMEQARSEERMRIAQDLHDDIGARLLTLMYKAGDPETEDYVRHTLKDLKTLTRGLAASNHRLSHAAAEWKADLSQRLGVAHCELRWSFTMDKDMTLTVVQWSALTRILRELTNNVISHANASRLEVQASVQDGELTMAVTDNGQGSKPEAWQHGLGLNGVRKRIRQLNGHVEWVEQRPHGIQCRLWASLAR
ncbi:ATP-binding protein [Aquincola sp. MAHUQ-54]|uniref:histidine kinase n=1 Tax=Aquincola agrisoli TaxID=3119538 RepID=A0AAW9Q3H6_9BURK